MTDDLLRVHYLSVSLTSTPPSLYLHLTSLVSMMLECVSLLMGGCQECVRACVCVLKETYHVARSSQKVKTCHRCPLKALTETWLHLCATICVSALERWNVKESVQRWDMMTRCSAECVFCMRVLFFTFAFSPCTRVDESASTVFISVLLSSFVQLYFSNCILH